MSTYTVMPLRYSDDVPAMVRFLTTLGLARQVTTEGDRFAELRAGAGKVMVHAAEGADAPAAPGETVLCLATARADEASQELEAAGLQTTVWDESYGRQAMVTGPAGEAIWINEEQQDLYGYQGHGEEPDARIVATAIRPSTDFAADRAFFEKLGLTADPGASEFWTGMRGDGVVGIHQPHEGWRSVIESEDPRHRFPLVHLGFETSEPLEELRDRLAAAGYPAEVVVEDVGPKVHVTDPDGQTIEIHPLP